jgi:hypothetical protein
MNVNVYPGEPGELDTLPHILPKGSGDGRWETPVGDPAGMVRPLLELQDTRRTRSTVVQSTVYSRLAGALRSPGYMCHHSMNCENIRGF